MHANAYLSLRRARSRKITKIRAKITPNHLKSRQITQNHTKSLKFFPETKLFFQGLVFGLTSLFLSSPPHKKNMAQEKKRICILYYMSFPRLAFCVFGLGPAEKGEGILSDLLRPR